MIGRNEAILGCILVGWGVQLAALSSPRVEKINSIITGAGISTASTTIISVYYDVSSWVLSTTSARCGASCFPYTIPFNL